MNPNVGATPFQGRPFEQTEDTKIYYSSPRYKAFEKDLREEALARGLRIGNEGRPLPELEETGGSLIVTLSSPLAPDYATGIVSDSSDGQPLLAQTVNPTQQAILDYLGQEEAASVVNLQKRLPMRSRRALTYDLQELMTWGLVERTGAGPATRYRLPPGFSPRTNAR